LRVALACLARFRYLLRSKVPKPPQTLQDFKAASAKIETATPRLDRRFNTVCAKFARCHDAGREPPQELLRAANTLTKILDRRIEKRHRLMTAFDRFVALKNGPAPD
jgi:hypothetical protein